MQPRDRVRVEVLLVVPHREEREQLGIARDLELRDLEEVVDGLALDIGEVTAGSRPRCAVRPMLARELPVEILDLDSLRDGDVLSDV